MWRRLDPRPDEDWWWSAEPRPACRRFVRHGRAREIPGKTQIPRRQPPQSLQSLSRSSISKSFDQIPSGATALIGLGSWHGTAMRFQIVFMQALSGVLDQLHESVIHVQLLMAV